MRVVRWSLSFATTRVGRSRNVHRHALDTAAPVHFLVQPVNDRRYAYIVTSGQLASKEHHN